MNELKDLIGDYQSFFSDFLSRMKTLGIDISGKPNKSFFDPEQKIFEAYAQNKFEGHIGASLNITINYTTRSQR